MKYFVFVLACAGLAPASAPKVLPLMPMPASVTLGSGAIAMNLPLRVAWPKYSDARLRAAAEKLATRISHQTGVPRAHLATDSLPTLGVTCDASSPEWPASGWVAQQMQTLDQLAKPVAEVQLAAVRPVKILVEAAGRGAIQ